MASTTIKSTYSLDVETVKTLDALARHWNVPKSRALRRVIRAAAEQEQLEDSTGIAALDALQQSLDLSEEAARLWQERARTERQAS